MSDFAVIAVVAARELAKIDPIDHNQPPGMWPECFLCKAQAAAVADERCGYNIPGEIEHFPTCPWELARIAAAMEDTDHE